MKLKLPDVTLFQFNCVDPHYGVNSLLYSSKDIEFAKIILVSDVCPSNITDSINFYKIEKSDHAGSSRFSFEELIKYVDTKYVLSTHPDGYVINPQNWDDIFYQYDYIGAPWPNLPWCSRNRVGNGGFVWKSKKFIELTSKLKWNGEHDDVMVTNTYYDYFIQNGCKYAPLEIAAKFSLEHEIPEVKYDLNNCFGFHGKNTEESRKYVEFIKSYRV